MSFRLIRRTRAQLVIDAVDAKNSVLSAEDRQRKYRKMARSPYNFLRGTNHLYWHDIWHEWRYHLFGGVAETQTWLQGDAHVYNHGIYGHRADALRYGMDDFDDALIGDYQYDLWRHATSMVLDARENVQLSESEIRRAIRHLLTAYLGELHRHRHGEKASSADMDNHKRPVGPFMSKVARKKGRKKHLDKWTVVTDGERRFNTELRKLAAVSQDTRQQIIDGLANQYRDTLETESAKRIPAEFQIKDVARRINAGIGSLGLLRYYVLLEGATQSPDDDLILDIKQQINPAAWQFMTDEERKHWRATFPSEGERHAAAFRALSDYGDDYLGWLILDDQAFSVRERSPFKQDFPTHKISKLADYRRLTQQWGRFMAREHIRGARALRPEEPAFFCQAVLARCDNRVEAFKELVCSIAFSYAECVNQDHQVFVQERTMEGGS